ncbi:hypothetical protein LT350_33710 [Mycolicibacterium smegmatis]|uniref:hypothetical protein n=1 Tax=Mycolicibacterium smegmatis TaxID=1772 RepID=UPI001E525ED6|nr:hypothetical protein [Mycolicibacterium smegmatis]UGU31380.1 hypothetical protein LT350_33710 [Mycolicibacterium smegmatis]ULN72276.1 hypothetical protein KZ782_10455 [Mycolicibacterium smegmatis]
MTVVQEIVWEAVDAGHRGSSKDDEGQPTLFEDVVVPGKPAADPLLGDLKALIRNHDASRPRSKQKTLGPSEVGHPCTRKLAQGLMQIDRINPAGDVLPSYVGTAVHAQLEQAVAVDNGRIVADHLIDPTSRCTWLDGKPIGRWISERRVTIRPDLSGSCDLFDTWNHTVLDLKVPGVSKMTEYRRNGPSEVYRRQAHLYGRGYRNAGFQVDRVGIWFLPRAGQLSTSHLWTEPYDDALVDETLARIDNAIVLIHDFDVENHPERWAWFPKTVEACTYCPFFTPTANHPNPAACRAGAG